MPGISWRRLLWSQGPCTQALISMTAVAPPSHVLCQSMNTCPCELAIQYNGFATIANVFCSRVTQPGWAFGMRGLTSAFCPGKAPKLMPPAPMKPIDTCAASHFCLCALKLMFRPAGRHRYHPRSQTTGQSQRQPGSLVHTSASQEPFGSAIDSVSVGRFAPSRPDLGCLPVVWSHIRFVVSLDQAC